MMTRILIVVLVTLNLGVLLWAIFQPSLDISTTAPAFKEGAQLELITPGDIKAQAISPHPITPYSADRPTVLIAAQPAELSHIDADEKQKTDDHCGVIAGFSTKEAALAARVQIADLSSKPVDVRLSQGENDLFQVTLAINGNRRAVQDTIAHLESSGIHDIFLKGKINQQWMIALGQYRQRDGALRRHAAIVAAGMTPIVQQLRQKNPKVQWDLIYQGNVGDDLVKKRFPLQTVRVEECRHDRAAQAMN